MASDNVALVLCIICLAVVAWVCPQLPPATYGLAEEDEDEGVRIDHYGYDLTDDHETPNIELVAADSHTRAEALAQADPPPPYPGSPPYPVFLPFPDTVPCSVTRVPSTSRLCMISESVEEEEE